MDDEIIGTNPEAREYLKIAVVCAMCQNQKENWRLQMNIRQ